MTAAAPSGVVTFLFTDVAPSTSHQGEANTTEYRRASRSDQGREYAAMSAALPHADSPTIGRFPFVCCRPCMKEALPQ
jgi:hypothetical protein